MPEQNTTDHRHEWRLTVGHSECKECHYSSIEGVAACKHCDESIGPTEIERRLNAVEQLSAKTALAIWRKLDALSQEHLGYEFSLFAYAEALEK